MEFDFIVAPGSDVSQIRMALETADKVSIDLNGDVIVNIQSNEFRILAPAAYQCDSNKCQSKTMVTAEYKLAADHKIEFALGSYDPNKTLVIDPKISFGTMLGGNTYDSAIDVAVDTKGNFYVVGYTEANTRIPGNGDGFVQKFSPTGALIWSTFLVGNSGEEANAIAVNPAGICFIGGSTSSRDFPIVGAFQPNYGGSLDGFIVKLAANGTIMRSSFIGGSDSDLVNGVELGTGPHLGNGLYLYGTTRSRNFPKKNAGQTQYGGGFQDGFLTLVHSLSFQQLMSTYIGTAGNDNLTSLSLNTARGDLYAAVLSDQSQGPFIAHLKPKSSSTNSKLQPQAPPDDNYEHGLRTIAGLLSMPVEIVGNMKFFKYLALTIRATLGIPNAGTASTELLSVFAIDVCLPVGNCTDSSAIVFLDPNLNVKKTVNFGGPKTGGIFVNNLAAKPDGTIYVVGDALSTSLPTVNAFQPSSKGSWEGFVIRFAPNTQQVTLSSYIGGSAADFASSVAVDKTGNIFVAGSTSSKNFPTTPGAPKRTITGKTDGYVIKITP